MPNRFQISRESKFSAKSAFIKKLMHFSKKYFSYCPISNIFVKNKLTGFYITVLVLHPYGNKGPKQSGST